MPRVLFCGPLILLEKCGCYFTRIRKLVYGLNMANQGSLHQSFESLRVFSQNLSNNQNILPSCVNKIVEVRPFRLNSGFEMTTSESNQYFKRLLFSCIKRDNTLEIWNYTCCGLLLWELIQSAFYYIGLKIVAFTVKYWFDSDFYWA